ncbi:AraC family transcriptional regulator [Paenibacillus thalictri]|uniref:AraC family transcriptional regulator n=1 Tax=Paenibacillus thalictri TaxID=2527873 RepID=A0A4Q9DQ65_9BACL|nr:AraC family transcriptional regulator [Paenibacillus thalictri]TBL78548.1 AraC family transcriptional regulator [Paenibacillus thalictri]
MTSWTCLPVLLTDIHWVQKERFLLDVDTYENWTLFAVEQGKFHYRTGESEGDADFGDLVFCPPGVPFHRRVIDPLTFHFCHFDWPHVPDSPTPVCGAIRINDVNRLASNYTVWSQGADSPGSLQVAAHLLNDLWYMLALQESVQDAARHHPEDPDMQAIAHWLQQHLAEPVSLKQVAASYRISPVQLTRRFTRAHGVSPNEYVTNLRLKKAQALLVNTHETLDRIARQCGYENGFYLSRVFTHRYGTSPSRYRASRKL